MHKATFITSLICIMLAAGLFFGCSDDSPTTPNPPVEPPEETNFAGSIGVYMDAEGLDDNLVDTGFIVKFYVVHKVEYGATASSFRIEAPEGWTLLAANSEFPVSVGNITDGISIGYGRCASGSIHVMTLTYQSPGNTPTGSVFKVLPHTQWPDAVQSVDCQEVLHDDGKGVESPVVIGQPSESLAGNIGVYMDAAGLDNDLVDTGDIVQFYVVHKVEYGATASSFRIEAPAGWNLLAANSEFPVSVGNITDGISIGYGRCASGVVHIMTLTYQSPGNTPAGSVFRVLPHTQWPDAIQSVDCQEALHEDGEGVESPVVEGPPPPGLGGSIGLYGDPNGNSTFLLDNDGMVTYYLIHKVERGATASQFRVEAPAGWTLLAENYEFPVHIGNAEEGISIGYGRCAYGNILVGTLTYESPGDTPAGTRFKVLPHYLYDSIEVVDCREVLLTDALGMESPLVKE
ncbi:MAG: hypothetical protein P8181_04220 [bacterium]